MKYTASFTLGLLTALSSYAIAQTVSPSASSLALLPAEIQVPTDQQLLLTVKAEGDQIYTCQAQADAPNQFEWTLKAPEALLYDERGQEVGHHLRFLSSSDERIEINMSKESCFKYALICRNFFGRFQDRREVNRTASERPFQI
ncbi:DUF3455 domain-containing protein [Leptolyngbya sp. 7M]|uniref:DUF3455 domain-containing protein n=1 Tax=Leptolyngbya sp. 7M TaxID=2812896 RepID=UPI001B8C98CC|nr:DUF3455 domain-containing protein [Leptolyngbya sp. 7M]QYO64109.1 DUF3455 domain-containing protein [Leptolyngbya sp. 7M]